MAIPMEETKKVETVRGDEDVEFGEVKNIDLPKDKALALLATADAGFSPAEADEIRKKIDYIIMPMLFCVYTMMLIDKSSLSFAAVMGIKTDCNLTGAEYSWLGSLVYFGYLAGDIPSAIVLQRYNLHKSFSLIVIVWGMVVAVHAACGQFASLAVLRFLLGFGEVFTTPAVLHVFGSWYTKDEQVTRLPIWYTCYGFATMLGGFFSWCIYQAPSFNWRALYIFYGGLTITFGVVMFFFLPASPTDAWWLTERQKVVALERVRDNKTGTEIWKFNASQLRESLLDIRFYIVFLIVLCLGLPTGGISVFGPTIIAGFGFTNEQSTLLSMAPGAAAVVGVLTSVIVAKYMNRTSAGVFIFIISIVGVIMMFAIPSSQVASRYGGYVLTLQFPNSVPHIMALMTSGISGSTKKFAFAAAFQLGYSVGNIIGPQTFRAVDAPNYYPAKYTMLAFLVFGLLLMISWGMVHKLWNMRRDKRDTADGQSHEYIENEEFLDKTDFAIRSFRYPL